MSALSEAVEKHRRRIQDDAGEALRAASIGDDEDREAIVAEIIDGLLGRVRRTSDTALRDNLCTRLSDQTLSRSQVAGAMIRVGAAVRTVLFVALSSRRVASIASGAIDRVMAEILEEVHETVGAGYAEDPDSLDMAFGGQAPTGSSGTFGGGTGVNREPTIIRNIKEILGDEVGELQHCTVLVVQLRAPSATTPAASVRELCLTGLSNSNAQKVVDWGDVIGVAFPAAIENHEVHDALNLALSIVRTPGLAACSVGIARGELTLASDGGQAVGDPLNRAMALAHMTEPGFVRCDEAGYEATAATYVLRPRPLEQRSYRLDPNQPKWLDRWEHASFVAEPVIVGRTEERRQLRTLIRSGRKICAVGLKGPSGIGKLRLLTETLADMGVAQDRVLLGQPHPLTPAPYWPLISIARQVLELRDGPLVASTLREHVRKLAASSATTVQLQALEPTLGTLLGVEDADEAAIEELEASAMRTEIAKSMRLLLEAAADRQPDTPLVVLIRDAQNLDAPTGHALSHILRMYDGAAQLIVVLCYRGTFKPSATFEQASFTEIPLERLEYGDVLAIARSMLEQDDLPPPLEAILKKRADGIPIRTEMLIRFLIETGSLQRRGGQWINDGLPKVSEIPRRLSELIHQRIDNLPANLSGMLKSAAVVGETLPQGTAELVWVSRGAARDDIGRHTGLLMELGFLSRSRTDVVHFAHPFLREVAYKMQTPEDLKATHGLVAEAYRERYPDAINQLPAVLFHHSNEAGDVDHARVAATHGARRAMLLRDHKRALALASEGLRLCDDESFDSMETRFDLLSVRERVHDARGARKEQGKNLEKLVDLAESLGGQRRGTILHRAARFALLTGNLQKARVQAEESVIQLKNSGEPLDLSNALRTVALVRWTSRDAKGAAEALTEALKIYEKLDHRRGMGFVLHNLGLFALDMGGLDQARRYFERALELKESTQDRDGAAVVLDALGQVSLLEGNTKEAAMSFEKAVGERLATGNLAGAAPVQVNLGEALIGDQPEKAEELARSAIRFSRGKKNLRTNIEANILLSRALMAQGKKQTAGRPASLSIKRAREIKSNLLVLRGQLAQAEVDLAYKSTQRAERALIQAQAAAETALDAGAIRWRIEALSLLATAYARLDPESGVKTAKEALQMLGEKKHPGLDEAKIRARCEPIVAQLTTSPG